MFCKLIASFKVRFQLVIAVCLTIVLGGCLESPETLSDRTGQTPEQNQSPADGDGHDHDHDAGNNTDTGNNTTPNTNVPDGTDYVSGYWGTTETLGSTQYAAGSSPTVQSQKIQISHDQNVFLSWSTKMMVNGALKEELKFMRAAFDSASGYTWSELGNSAFLPAGITDASTETQFTVNHSNKEAYALWNDGAGFKVSTFMEMGGGIAHFMGTASIAESHVPQMLVNEAGDAYLVTQSHMQGGFGINVHKRVDTNNWTDAVALHRMDMTNEIQLPNHFIKSVIDGNDNIFVVWLELHNGLVRLMAVTYNVLNDSWGTPAVVVDSTNTHGLDLSALASISATGSAGSSDMHLAMFQSSGTSNAVFTLDSAQGVWQMPMRRDAQTATQKIRSTASYASDTAGHAVVAWIEKDTATDIFEIKALRLSPNTGWGTVEEITSTQAGTAVDTLLLDLNSHGAALATWYELDSNGSVRLLSSTQVSGQAWPQKEIVANFTNGQPLAPMTGIHENGLPWVAWLMSASDANNDSLTVHLVKRLVSTSTSTSGNTDPNNNGGTDTGGTNTGGDGHDHDHGGDTGGTGTGTDTGGTGTGGTDTGGNNTTTATWHTSVKVGTSTLPVASQIQVNVNGIQTTADGDLFATWETNSNPDASGVYAQQDISLIRGSLGTSGMYTWSDSTNSMFKPVGYTAAAKDAQFVAFPGMANGKSNGLAVWNDNGVTFTSEFMGDMGHFMGNAELANGYSPQVLVNSMGDVYLLMETEMNGGFGLSVYKRTAADQWSTPDMLHRMDMALPITMPNHFLTAIMDGQDNIRAIWLEQHDGMTSMHTATYAIAADGTGAWGPFSDVETHNMLMLDKLVSGTMTMSANSKELNVILHQINNSEHSVYSVVYSASSGWNMPMRLDMADTAIQLSSAPQIAHNDQGDVIVSWVETNAAMTATNTSGLMNMLMARQYSVGAGWEAAHDIVHAPMMADISAFDVALSDAGDAAASWVEADANNNQLMASFHIENGTGWSAKETIKTIAAVDGMVDSLKIELDANTNVNVLWSVKKSDNVNDTIELWQTMRMPTLGSGTGTGTGDTGTGTGGTGTGGTGTGDTGTGTGMTPTAISGLWDTSTNVQITEMPIANQATVTSPKLQINSTGDLFVDWKILSTPNANMIYAEQKINIIRGDLDTAGNYSWSTAGNTMFNPVSYDATTARNAKFMADHDNANGISVWNNNGVTFTSEFMNSMGHFMNNAELPNGFNPQILFASTGDVYLLMETEMGGGFGLSVFKRTAADQWSTAVMMHRMDMANAYSIQNHNLIASLDSQNNIHVMWVEEQVGNTVQTLNTAKYTTSSETWGTLAEIHAHNMTLAKVVSGVLSDTTNESMSVVLHELDGANRKTFSVQYDATSGWAMPVRLDSEVAGTNQVTAPTVARNANGHLMVAWVETIDGMTATNMSGLMNVIAVKRYMPGMGWHADIEHVTHAAMDAEAAGIEISLNHTGDASLIWKEASMTSTNIISSHLIAANTEWSQRELIQAIPNTDGMVMDLTILLDHDNMPHMLWSVKQNGTVNDSLQIWQTKRLTSIADATTGSGTGTGSGDTGGGTGTGSGGTGSNTPVNLNWTIPVKAVELMQNGSVDFEMGKEPQIVMDSFGNTTVKFAMTTTSTSNGSTVTSTNNKISHSADGINWHDLLASTTLFDDLSTAARMESIHAVPLTGNLYGLIRDPNKLYLARYVENTGWSKIEIPEVPANIASENIQVAVNETGMITIVWIESIPNSFNVNINAKHFMVATGWDATQSIAVAFEKILSPHYIDSNGNVYATWLVSNPNSNSGLFDVKMASYAPMEGWSAVMDGPEGIRNVYPNTVSGGHHKVIVDADDLDSHTIDAYVIRHDGSWTKFPNINHKLPDDQIVLANRDDVQVVMGDAGQFVVAWSEVAVDDHGHSVLRYMTVTAHMMTDSVTNMEMMHWTTPTEVGGMNSDMESSLQFAITSTGDVQAVWIGDLNKVYVNTSNSDGVWNVMPDMLAEYDLASDVVALNPRIVIGGMGKISIAWDEYSKSSAMTMHKIWVVQNQ